MNDNIVNVQDILEIFKDYTSIVINNNFEEEIQKEKELDNLDNFLVNLRNEVNNIEHNINQSQKPKIIKSESIKVKKKIKNDILEKVTEFTVYDKRIFLTNQNYSIINDNMKQILNSNLIFKVENLLSIENLLFETYDYKNMINVFNNIIFFIIIIIFLEEINNMNLLLNKIKIKFFNNKSINDIINSFNKKDFFDFIKKLIYNSKIDLSYLKSEVIYNDIIVLGKLIIKEFINKNDHTKIRYDGINDFINKEYININIYNNIENLILLVRQMLESIYLYLDLNNNIYYIRLKNKNNLIVKNTLINKNKKQKYNNGIILIFEENNISIYYPILNKQFIDIKEIEFKIKKPNMSINKIETNN